MGDAPAAPVPPPKPVRKPDPSLRELQRQVIIKMEN